MTLFSKILNGEIPGTILHKDDLCFAIQEIRPQAPKHILLMPRKEIPSIAEAQPEDAGVLGHMLIVAGQLAREHGLSESGYRIVINTGADAGQSVFHIHMHVLGGREFHWPPG